MPERHRFRKAAVMRAKRAVFVATGALLGGVMLVALPQSATAKPEFTVSTSKPCVQCHQNPGGGGKLKPYGEAFKANGFKVKK
jgi:hypothetical protein